MRYINIMTTRTLAIHRVWRTLKIGFALCAAMPLFATPTHAQAPAPAQEASAAMQNPDVQILVIALPGGNVAVSSVYPGQVPKATAQGRVDKLLALTGWRATNRTFSDAPTKNPLESDAAKKLSAASFETVAPIFPVSGQIDSEPFLRAFGDLHRVNLIYMPGAGTAYTGARRFESPRLSLTALPSGQGTVAIAATVKQPETNPAPFGIPATDTEAQALISANAPKAPRNAPGENRTFLIVIVIAFAAGSALVVYGLASRYVGKA